MYLDARSLCLAAAVNAKIILVILYENHPSLSDAMLLSIASFIILRGSSLLAWFLGPILREKEVVCELDARERGMEKVKEDACV